MRLIGLGGFALVAMLLVSAVVADAAPMNVCVPEKEGAAVVTPVKGACKAKFTESKLLPLAEAEKLDEILPHIKYIEKGTGGHITIQFSGVNLQVVNGAGVTESANGLGNLVLGYDELQKGALEVHQSGSHNLIMGQQNEVKSWGGIITGTGSIIKGRFATVLGGSNNAANADFSSVTGGFANIANGIYASISGGERNDAAWEFSAIAGGMKNVTNGIAAAVSGGNENTAGGSHGAWVGGGWANASIGSSTAIGGGNHNKVTGANSAIAGGDANVVEGGSSTIAGGKENIVAGELGDITGGSNNTIGAGKLFDVILGMKGPEHNPGGNYEVNGF